MSTEPTPERAHYVRQPAEWVAGCSDIGLRHDTNQDAMSIAARQGDPPAAVLVVADGVSATPGSEEASRVAAEAAVDAIVSARDRDETPEAAVAGAFPAAHASILGTAPAPAASTLIAALIEGRLVVIGNVGDSRAYWVGDDGATALLSTDDSLAQARIGFGMERDDAEQSLQAHALTKWLGGRSEDTTPSIVTFEAPGPGVLVLCSDGLWNYASAPDRFGAAVAAHDATRAAALVSSLVEWANLQGGRDNVTVAVARFD